MSLPPAFEHMKKYPGMYFPRVTFDVVAAFVNGFNHAHNGCFLIGFREWLIVKVDDGNNLTWDGLVFRLAFPEADELDEAVLHGSEDRGVAALFELLEGFLRERESAHGLRRIFHQYEAWLKRQEWYDSSSPMWIDETTEGDSSSSN